MELFVTAAVCGVVIGIFSGLLGIGGGTLMVPLFRLGFGLPAIGATATSLFTIIPTSLAGCITHIRNKTCIPRLGVVTGLAGACTSPLGVYLASISPAWTIMLAAALIIGYSAFTMIRKAIRMPKPSHSELALRARIELMRRQFESDGEGERELRGREEAQAHRDAPQEDDLPSLTTRQLLIGALIGLVAGLASGYVGVGGGFIMVPLFIAVLGVMMKQASGTSLLAVCILALPGVVSQAALGNIDYIAGIAMAVGSIPGALIGASLIRFVPERRLRFIFGGFLLVSALILAINEFAPLLFG